MVRQHDVKYAIRKRQALHIHVGQITAGCPVVEYLAAHHAQREIPGKMLPFWQPWHDGLKIGTRSGPHIQYPFIPAPHIPVHHPLRKIHLRNGVQFMSAPPDVQFVIVGVCALGQEIAVSSGRIGCHAAQPQDYAQSCGRRAGRTARQTKSTPLIIPASAVP